MFKPLSTAKCYNSVLAWMSGNRKSTLKAFILSGKLSLTIKGVNILLTLVWGMRLSVMGGLLNNATMVKE